MLVQQSVQFSYCLLKIAEVHVWQWFAANFNRDGLYIGLENWEHSLLPSLCGGNEKISSYMKRIDLYVLLQVENLKQTTQKQHMYAITWSYPCFLKPSFILHLLLIKQKKKVPGYNFCFLLIKPVSSSLENFMIPILTKFPQFFQNIIYFPQSLM